MDISQKRRISQDLLKYVSLLKFKDHRIILAGTAGMASQQYFSDYDLLSIIDKKYSNEYIYNTIHTIIKKTDELNDMYFIELKIQNKDESKKKFFNIEDINENDFIKSIKNLDFIKLDYIIRLNNKFIELSIIYSFKEIKETDETNDNNEKELLKNLNDDVKELQKEGNYFKSVKRIFSIYNSLNITKKLWDKSKMLKISEFLNSDIGALYAKNSNLKAIKLLLENYDDNETKRRALLNLKDLGIEPNLNKIDEMIKKNDTAINKEGFEFLKTIK
jgi:hypothetical protein